MFSRAQFCVAVCRNNGLLLPARMCTAAHTLDVKQKIGEKKKEAQLGGGVKRIETQHKRVRREQHLHFIFLLIHYTIQGFS